MHQLPQIPRKQGLLRSAGAKHLAPFRQTHSFLDDAQVRRICYVVDDTAECIENRDVAFALTAQGNKSQGKIRFALTRDRCRIHIRLLGECRISIESISPGEFCLFRIAETGTPMKPKASRSPLLADTQKLISTARAPPTDRQSRHAESRRKR